MEKRQTFNRKQFLRLMAALGLSPVLGACSRAVPLSEEPAPSSSEPSPTPHPTATASPSSTPEPSPSATSSPSPSATLSPTPTRAPTEVPARGRVALIRTDDRRAGVRRAIDLLGVDGPAGGNVLVKPNYNSADPPPGSTHDDVLRTLMEWLGELPTDSVLLAERSGMGETRRVLERRNVFAMGRELGFQVQVLDELEPEAWELIQSAGGHWQRGFPFPTRLFQEADYVLQTCCLKTHRYGGHFTLSLKNSVGLVAKYVPGQSYDYMRELHNCPDQRRMIAEINTAYAPDLVVLDGVEAFVNGGPAQGERVQSNVILAGSDRVALDAVGVAILRHFGTTPAVSQGRVFDQEQIRRAADLGLGASGPEEIDILTDDEAGGTFADDLRQILTA